MLIDRLAANAEVQGTLGSILLVSFMDIFMKSAVRIFVPVLIITIVVLLDTFAAYMRYLAVKNKFKTKYQKTWETEMVKAGRKIWSSSSCFRDTLCKWLFYFGVMVALCSFCVTYDDTMKYDMMLFAGIFAFEGGSAINNFLRAHGYSLNLSAIWQMICKKANMSDFKDIIEEVPDDKQ
jgi:hypothetical protein